MPLVSIIVPCFNEQATIRLLLDAIYRQTLRSSGGTKDDMEVIIADGLSTDRTRDVVAIFQQEHPDLPVHLVDNPQRIIPAALNRAIAAAQGEYIIRLDAHSAPASDYVERCVAALKDRKGENVGGVWKIRPQGNGLIARAIAIAAAHPFGVGDAHYRYTTQASYVDTVPFGAFRRDVFAYYGLFDEALLTNEDYEFNARLRQNGGRIWLDPGIQSTYYARPDLKALGRQYWRYGYWKWQMLRRYPRTLRWRQVLPPVFVLSLIILLIASLFWRIPRWLLVAEIVVYGLLLVIGSVPAARRNNDWGLVLAVPLAIMTMHLAWGSGFLWGMISANPVKAPAVKTS